MLIYKCIFVGNMKTFSWLHGIVKKILLPFSSGTSPTAQPGESNMNEEISPTLTFAHLVSCFCIVLGIYSGKQTTDDTARAIVWGLVMGLVSCGVIALVVLIFSNSVVIPQSENTETKDYSMNLRIIFLWLFGLAVILQSAVNFAIDLECVQKFPEENIIYIGFLSSSVLVLFIILQMGAITYFRNHYFNKSVQINFAVVFISLANFGLWFNSVVSNLNDTYTTNPNISHMIIFKNATSCYFDSKIQHALNSKLTPFLLPTRMEFFILASSFFISFWHSSSKQQNCHSRVISEELIHGVCDETTALLPRSTENRASHVFAIMISIFLSLPTFLTWLLLSFVYKDDSDHLNTAYEICHCFNSLAIIVIVYITFDNLSRRYIIRENHRPLTTSETILVFSSAGVVAYSTYGLLFALQSQVSEHMAALFRNIFWILETFLQTSLLIQCQRYVLSEKRSKLLSSFALVITITNLINWFLYSVYQNGPTEGRELIVGNKRNWAYVKTILVPLLIFYRFTSAMNSYSLYNQIKP